MTATRTLEEPSVYFESKSKTGTQLDQSSRHKSLFLPNGLAIFGRDDGTIRIYDFKQKKSFPTSVPLVDLRGLKKQYEDAHGCAPHYGLGGFNFRAAISPHCVFLLTDFLNPEFFILNLKNLGEFQKVPFNNVTAISILSKGNIVVGTSKGEIFISESAYKFGDKITFKFFGHHKGWINSIASLSSTQFVSCSDSSLEIWDISTKNSIKKFPIKGSNCTLKILAKNKFILSDHNGIKFLDANNWSGHGFDEHVVDAAVHKGYLAAAILEEYKPIHFKYKDILSEDDYPAQRDDKIRALSTKMHLTKSSLMSIKIWDIETWECVCHQPFLRLLEDTVSIDWTPTGNLMIYEKYSTTMHHLNVVGLTCKKSAAPESKPGLFSTSKEAKESGIEVKEHSTLKVN